jgi:ABC-type multidrug transport system ATPase subunit
METITAPEVDRGTGSDVLIRAEDIEKTYGSRLPFTRTVPVLHGADIELRGGEIVGIVGGNGSGKSTLMNILVGILDADSGTVERTGTVGWCPQESLLYDRLTVDETFRLFGSGYGMTHDEIGEAKTRLADQLGFEQYLDYRIDQLSGGNRQKVNLGIALMHDPDVLLLDEPYTGFDWETYLQFWDIAEELADDGVGIAMISHLIEERSRLDRIYELRDGVVNDVTDDETDAYDEVVSDDA